MSWWRSGTSDKDYSAYSSDLSSSSSSSNSIQEVEHSVFAGMWEAIPYNMIKYTFQQRSRSKWIKKQIDNGQEFAGTF